MPSNSSKKLAPASNTAGRVKDEETVDAAAAAESPVSTPNPRCKHIQELFSTSTDLAQNFCELTQLFVDETHQKEFLEQRDHIRLISAKADGINLAQEMMRNFLHSPEASVTNCGSSGLSSASSSTALPPAERDTNDSESVLVKEAQSLANEARDRQKDLSLVLDKMVDNLSKCKEISSNLPDFNIPANLIQYIDSHKSPQLFSKQYLDDVYESNKNSMSKMLQFSLFRAKLMNEVFKIYPEEILKYKEKINIELQHGN
ncbi:MAG: Mediator of RNA polymerase II transcription subunit 10 [Marteilia pararefringens]